MSCLVRKIIDHKPEGLKPLSLGGEICRGQVMMLSGAPGTMKSLLTLDWAYSKKFFGQFQIPEDSKILYVMGDMTYADLQLYQKRLGIMDKPEVQFYFPSSAFKLSLQPDTIYVDTEIGWGLLKEAIELIRPDVLIFDSLFSCLSISPAEHKAAQQFILKVKDLAMKKDFFTLFLHHPIKRKKKKLDASDSYGSVVWEALIDAMIGVKLTGFIVGGSDRASQLEGLKLRGLLSENFKTVSICSRLVGIGIDKKYQLTYKIADEIDLLDDDGRKDYIERRAAEGTSFMQIAAELSVARGTVYNILNRSEGKKLPEESGVGVPLLAA